MKAAHEQLAELRPDLYDDLLNWVRFGHWPESRLVHAVLRNDLQHAVAHAGEEVNTLRLLVQTVYNYIPSAAWTDRDARNLWHVEREKTPMRNFKFGDC